jgi:hypothetical protein
LQQADLPEASDILIDVQHDLRVDDWVLNPFLHPWVFQQLGGLWSLHRLLSETVQDKINCVVGYLSPNFRRKLGILIKDAVCNLVCITTFEG